MGKGWLYGYESQILIWWMIMGPLPFWRQLLEFGGERSEVPFFFPFAWDEDEDEDEDEEDEEDEDEDEEGRHLGGRAHPWGGVCGGEAR